MLHNQVYQYLLAHLTLDQIQGDSIPETEFEPKLFQLDEEHITQFNTSVDEDSVMVYTDGSRELHYAS